MELVPDAGEFDGAGQRLVDMLRAVSMPDHRGFRWNAAQLAFSASLNTCCQIGGVLSLAQVRSSDSNHGYTERHQAALAGRGALGAQEDG